MWSTELFIVHLSKRQCWKNKLLCVLCRRLDLAQLHRRSREKGSQPHPNSTVPPSNYTIYFLMRPRNVQKEWVRKSTSGSRCCRYRQRRAALHCILQLSQRGKSNWVKLFEKLNDFTLVISCLSHRMPVETNYAPYTRWVTSSVPRQHLSTCLLFLTSKTFKTNVKPSDSLCRIM